MNSFERGSTPESQKDDPLESIRSSLEGALSVEPFHNSSSCTLSMSREEFISGIWGSALKKALEDGTVTYEVTEAEEADMDNRQLNQATDPNEPKTFYKHTITSTT